MPHIALNTQISEDVAAPENDVLRVHEALEVLEQADPRSATIVELRYFGGLTDSEIADTLDISERTLRRGPRPFQIPPWMEPQVALQEPLDTSGSAIILSDDYNPLDLWAVDASETWRKAAMDMWSRDVLFA